MTFSLREQIFYLWKSPIERKGLNKEFKNEFIRYIGIEKEREYNNILTTLIQKAKDNKTTTVYFDNEIPFELNQDFVSYIKKELETMNINKLSEEDIKMFSNDNVNNKYLKALEYTVNLACSQENFMNVNIRNNFIVKLLLNTFNYIRNLKYSDDIINKCIYYGNISRHDAYFLIMLHKMSFDVIYINPTKDSEEIIKTDRDHLSILHKNSGIGRVETLKERCKQGNLISENQSSVLRIENQLEQDLYTNSGIFRPWQFKEDGYTESVFFNSSIIDLEENWNIKSSLRDGFSVKDRIVKVPYFFFEIEGIYNDVNKQKKLIEILKNDSVIFVNSPTNADSLLIENLGSKQVPIELFRIENKYNLISCLNNDGTFRIDKLKELTIYPFEKYRDSTEDFILKKINETILDRDLFVQQLDNKEKLIDFCYGMFLLNHKIVRAIDSFDFTAKVPKLVFYLEKEQTLSKLDVYILGFLSKVGFDIVVLSPAGLSGLSSYINKNRFNLIRLDTLNYESFWLDEDSNNKGFFSRIFGF